MSLCYQPLLRKIRKINVRRFSVQVTVNVKENIEDEEQNIPQPEFRTFENNPIQHNEQHLNKFYTVHPKLQKVLYANDFFPNKFEMLLRTFAECSLLIRRPALEIISCLNETDYTKPVNKYVLYGKLGVGKTTLLAHIVHYAFMKKFVLVHMPAVYNWFRYPLEFTSGIKPGTIDLTTHSSTWLRHFKRQNLELLQELDLKISKDYVWNPRETMTQGSPLLQLVEFGIERIKFSSTVVNILLSELKLASINGKCKTFIAIDGYNSFWNSYTRITDEQKKRITVERISITSSVKDITNFDWCNGAVVLTIDANATTDKYGPYLPMYLLGKEGFEHLDPFIPIHIENYNIQEFEAVIEYYKDRKWIRSLSEGGKKEIELLSGKNPWLLMDCCKSL